MPSEGFSMAVIAPRNCVAASFDLTPPIVMADEGGFVVPPYSGPVSWPMDWTSSHRRAQFTHAESAQLDRLEELGGADGGHIRRLAIGVEGPGQKH